MAEILVLLSAIQATTQLVEQAGRVIGRLRKAYQGQKALVEVLQRHERELSSVKAIIGVINDEEELQTANVTAEMRRLTDVNGHLVNLLKELDPKSTGRVKQFAHQFTKGSADEKKLSNIMEELEHVKASLVLRIQVTNVGVVRDMKRQLVANAEVIQRIDQFLREEVGSREGLRIAKLLKGRRPSNDGTVPLTQADLRLLTREYDGNDSDISEDGTLVDDAESTTSLSIKSERIILRNMARNQALQVNAAVGEDIWRDVTRLEIKDNVAEDQAVQVNHGTTLEVALLLMGKQDERNAAARERSARYRHDSVLSP